MIVVKVSYKNDMIQRIVMEGHAQHSERGTDIVCASASTIAIMTVNLIEAFKQEHTVSIDSKDGYIKITVKEHHIVVEKLLKNMITHLLDLSKQYPKNIKIN